MLKTKGAAIFNTHERPIKICMHKTEGLKRQALKGMFSLMYITNSLLKNKRMLLYECKKNLVAYYIQACVFFTQNIQNEGSKPTIILGKIMIMMLICSGSG